MNSLVRLHKRLLSGVPLSGLLHSLFAGLKVLSVLYELVARARVAFYRWGIRTRYRSSLPVISVGNLAAGGTGKTPVCDLLLKLARERGLRAALVSRGYGGNYRSDYRVVSNGRQILAEAAECGDEPLMLAQRNPEAVVVVARRRADGLRYLEQNVSVDLVVLDDGYQHLQVERDLNLLLLDATRPFGNGYVLPAGNLREPRAAVARADLILMTRYNGRALPPATFSAPVLNCRYRLSRQVRDLAGETLPLAGLRGRPLVLFAGVADPDAFAASVRQFGLEVRHCRAFDDHAVYSASIQRELEHLAGADGVLLTTEKDAVKLKAANFSVPCYVAGLDLHVDNTAVLEELFDTAINRRGRRMNLRKELLDILACPKCKGEVKLVEKGEESSIDCALCQLSYPVRDGIPVMLIDEARPLGK